MVCGFIIRRLRIWFFLDGGIVSLSVLASLVFQSANGLLVFDHVIVRANVNHLLCAMFPSA